MCSEDFNPAYYPVHSGDKSFGLVSVPFWIFRGHESQAYSNHGQTLERLAERGGLGLIEIACIIKDKDLRFSRSITARDALRIIQEKVEG